MKVLHIIRRNDDALSSRVIEEMCELNQTEQALLMIQDGVYAEPGEMRAYACAEDVRARGVETSLELVDYDRIVEMIFEFDKVITW